MPPKLDRDLVLQTLAGYAEVNRITEAERRARLATMTDAEAREIFDDLCARPNGPPDADDEGWRRLAEWRLEHKRQVRQVFERLARHMGLID